MTSRSLLPAIAGAAQVVQRPGEVELTDALGPIELMIASARAAAEDAGAPGLLGDVGWVGVAGGWFRFHNPGQLIAERIGAPGAATALAAVSGTGPQDLLGIAAERISRGEIDVALVVGGEARWSQQRLKRAGIEPGWLAAPGTGEPERVSGFADDMIEEAAVIGPPAVAYALFEDRLRAAAGLDWQHHLAAVAGLWSRFSQVAAANPYAWDHTAHAAAQICAPGPGNRMIATPYTKAMVANNTVDMASAVLLCSTDAARRAGIRTGRLVFPHVVASSNDTWRVAQRHELHQCPALAAAGAAAFERTGLSAAEVDHVDLYACFPAIVQMSAATLGFGLDRPLTMTGGLCFAGAGVGNATGHAIAAMVGAVRSGGTGLVHGNGGNATKHSVAIYSAEPPAGFARLDCQDRVEHRARPELPRDWVGTGWIEASTVAFDRNGPTRVLAAVRVGEARAWATSTDPDLIGEALAEPVTGRRAHRAADATLTLPG